MLPHPQELREVLPGQRTYVIFGPPKIPWISADQIPVGVEHGHLSGHERAARFISGLPAAEGTLGRTLQIRQWIEVEPALSARRIDAKITPLGAESPMLIHLAQVDDLIEDGLVPFVV